MDMVRALQKMLLAHKGAIILGVIAAILVAFPQVYFRIEHRNDGVYQGIELLPDSPWSPRVQEVRDGYYNFGSMYWKEGKDEPYLFQPFGSIVWAYVGKVFALDTNNTFLVSRILMTFATVLLGYTCVFLICRDKLVALTSIAVILLADSIVSAAGMTKMMHGISPEEFLSIGKPVHNTMIYIPFFAFLIAFWRWYTNPKIVYGILSAVLLGLNFYNYFYTWTYLYAFIGVLVLFSLFQKKWLHVWGSIAIYVGSLIVAIPYLINLHNVTVHPLYEEVSMRIGVLETHAPLFVGYVVVIALGLFAVLYTRVHKERYWFMLALLCAPFITMNQQLITGKVLQAGHYHWYFHKPIALIAVLAVFFYILSRSRFAGYRYMCAAVILTVSVGTGAFIQIQSYRYGTVDGGTVAVERQKYGPAMAWLEAHAQKDAVVLANDEVSQLVTIYTSQNVFYHRGASYSSLVATEDRLLDVLFMMYRLRGVDALQAAQLFHAEREYIAMNVHHLHYRDTYGSDSAIPDSTIDSFVEKYRDTLETDTPEWIEEILRTYEVEYIIWDTKTDPDWQLDALTFLSEVARSGDVIIYEVSRDNTELVE